MTRKFEELKRDPYYLRAKREGYRSRAVYKLMEINRLFRVIKDGDRVLDLGSAPGGWLQYIAERVGVDGLVVGVDVKPIKPLGKSNVKILNMDIFDRSLVEELKKIAPEFDVITSDVSANVTGVWDVDVARSIDINLRVLQIADGVLRTGGCVVSKVFEGRGVDRVVREFRKRFRFVKLFKPKASRKRSSEIYIIGIGYMPLRRYSRSL
ncbi:23S rRNA (uridine(2552)-2'-O)-methyltransferase [Candidatus Geothermarchaeota archaeon ex4572_27]|nr:MAG: 23S rRNA (uridine(2552)-2'-O)-methyltransferase [Candidatus Geothermarchaeota archaeon ex4572_27]